MLSNKLKISDDSIRNFSVIVLFLALTEVQGKPVDSYTTSRSLIMENNLSSNEFDSCRFYVNVTSLNSDKLQIFWNPAPPLAHGNLPQISCASCQMGRFFSASLLSFSIRQTLQFNTASSEPQLGISCHPPIRSPISGSHQAHISSLPSDLKEKSPSEILFCISSFHQSFTQIA